MYVADCNTTVLVVNGASIRIRKALLFRYLHVSTKTQVLYANYCNLCAALVRFMH